MEHSWSNPASVSHNRGNSATNTFRTGLPDRLRLLVCDDCEVFGVGVQQVLQPVPDLAVVGQARTATRAVELARRLRPAVALVSHALREESDGGPHRSTGALAVVRTLSAAGVGVIVVGHSSAPQDLADAFRAGARGYLTRGVGSGRLLEAVRAVGRGETTLDPDAAAALLPHLSGEPATLAVGVEATSQTPGALTPRQVAIAELVAEGLSNSDIAGRLFLSQATVKSHMTGILRRLAVRDRTQLAILLNGGGAATRLRA